MRLIDAEKLISSFPKSDIIKDTVKTINYQETVNAIIIPENATNGDMIKVMFNPYSVKDYGYEVYVNLTEEDYKKDIFQKYLSEWWNSPYKRESEDKE